MTKCLPSIGLPKCGMGILLLGGFWGAAADLGAQNGIVETGDWVRARAGLSLGVYQVVEVSDECLLVRGPSSHAVPIRVPFASIEGLEVNGTGRTVGGNTLRGAGIGALAGGTIFGLMMFSVGDSGWVNKEELAVIGLVFGGGAGAVTGGMVGYLGHRSSWRDTELPGGDLSWEATGPISSKSVAVSFTWRH